MAEARPNAAALELNGVHRAFGEAPGRVDILAGADLRVAAGERVAVTGRSGSGKTTLVHIAAGMDLPDRGIVNVGGTRLSALGEPALTRFRARRIGLVFQDFNLIDTLTAAANIELPLWLNRLDRRRERVFGMAGRLEIEGLLDRYPATLSGGERQRVAIARALVHEPGLVLADEPTGSLDADSAERVLALFDRATRDGGAAVVMVTHSERTAALAHRRLRLDRGRLVAA